MTHTLRWFHLREHTKGIPKWRLIFIKPWKLINPYWFKHERKWQRIYLHRQTRHDNKVRIKKGMDIELERKTNGRLSH